jgi:hypothetical protein
VIEHSLRQALARYLVAHIPGLAALVLMSGLRRK